jgi:hypothetical protein
MSLMDLAEAAVHLKCTERWLATKLRTGEFPGHKIKRKWVLTEDDRDEILRLCAVPAAIPPATGVVSAASFSSMTPTTARRLQQSSYAR